MVDFTFDKSAPKFTFDKTLRQKMLEVFDPPDDGGGVPVIKDPEIKVKPLNFKFDAPAPKFTFDKPNIGAAFVKGAYAPFKPIVDAVPEGVESAIKGAANLESGMAAPFLSEEQKKKLQDKGLYTLGESPVKEFSQAAYSGLTSPLKPALDIVTGAAEKGADAAGVPAKVTSGVWGVVGTALDILGVAGLPRAGGKGATGVERPATTEQSPLKPGQESPVQAMRPEPQFSKGADQPQTSTAGALISGKKIVAAAVMNDTGQITEGKNHEAAYAKLGKKKDGSLKEGFVLANGSFITREEAAKLGQQTGQAPKTGVEPGKLHSEDVAAAAGKPPEEGVPLPERASDELFKMKNADEARRVQYTQDLKQIKGVPNETWEKLYAHKDNPAAPLSPEETALYDKHIAPIAARSEAILKSFKDDGIDFGDTGAAPRQVKGKNAYVEKLYGNKLKDNQVSGAGKRISTFSPAATSRSMWALPGKVGERPIVYVEGGKLYRDDQPVGEVSEGGKGAAGADTSMGKLQQATTAEIEKATKLEYHKNLLANEYIRVQSLERANDAKQFIEYLKKDPEFLDYATTAANKEAPASWRAVPVNEFEGYKFDPRLAEAIEDYMGNIKTPEDYTNAVMNVAKAIKASIFYNPIRHMINATNMFATSKGVAGTLRDAPNTPRALLKAVKSVITQDADFRAAAKEGMSLPSMREASQDFNKELMRAMGTAVSKDPKGMTALAKEWGYKSAAGMVKALYKGSNKLLWAYSDILAMTRMNEYMARGLSRAEAIKRTERVMANYRIPSHVLGSRNVSKALQDPRLTMFGRYDYNRFKNLTGMIKKAASADPGAWEARDQLLALAAITTLGYTVLDKWIQKKTGSPQAHQTLGGYSQLADVGKDVLSGKKSVSQGLQSLFSPGLLSLPLEAVTGENTYTGKKIVQRGDFVSMVNSLKEGDFDGAKDYAARIGFDLTKELADKFAPVGEADRYISGDMTPAEFWLSQIGTNVPSDDQEAGSAKAEEFMYKDEKGAAKKRPDWVP